MVILFDIIFIRLLEDGAISPFLQKTNNTPDYKSYFFTLIKNSITLFSVR